MQGEVVTLAEIFKFKKQAKIKIVALKVCFDRKVTFQLGLLKN